MILANILDIIHLLLYVFWITCCFLGVKYRTVRWFWLIAISGTITTYASQWIWCCECPLILLSHSLRSGCDLENDTWLNIREFVPFWTVQIVALIQPTMLFILNYLALDKSFNYIWARPWFQNIILITSEKK